MEKIIPKNEDHWLEERAKDITSTEVSALFGVSPYLTEFELWHRKKAGDIVKYDGNERTRWGLLLQDSIARGLAEEDGLSIRRMEEYVRDPKLRMGSSFDFAIIDLQYSTPKDYGILEIKNVDSLVFKNQWQIDQNTIEPPLHIQLQVQHQLALTGLEFAKIGALVGGNKLVKLECKPNKKIIDAIKIKIDVFWRSIESNESPSPNFELDADFISKLYGDSQKGKTFTVSELPEVELLARLYKNLSEEEKAIKSKKDAVKAQILTQIKDAEKVFGNDFTISAGMTAETEVSYKRDAYRNFRIFWKGNK